MQLASTAFENGGEIPRKYGKNEENVNPQLRIRDVPAEAKSLALIVDDPDAMKPAGKIWVHWVLFNIDPTTKEIKENSVPPGVVQGLNDGGNARYGGPAPPDARHTYIFKLYALDTTLDLKEGATKHQLEHAMQGHILAQVELKGTYTP